jgi:hypothetical protein
MHRYTKPRDPDLCSKNDLSFYLHGQPEVHLARLLVEVQRLLNVDGYQIISVDEVSGIIELDRQLLDEQFIRE